MSDNSVTTAQAPICDWGFFALDELGELSKFFEVNGFAVLRGLWSEEQIDRMDADCSRAQTRVASEESRHGNRPGFDLSDEKNRVQPSHVLHLTELSSTIAEAVQHPVITESIKSWLTDPWLMTRGLFGVVYQEARPAVDSGYTRIGWHTDWQSAPHLDRWPSVAFTIHIDGTSPSNGFLRVVPGSHKWATPAPYENANGVSVPSDAKPFGGHSNEAPPTQMPLTFDPVPGEIGIYCQRGDLLFHDAYLWHSAARGTDDESRRRHIRGAWYTGENDQSNSPDRFIKNAAR